MQIQLANITHITPLFQIYKDCKIALDDQGIFQWTDTYPNIKTVEHDIESREIFILKDKNQLVGVVILNEDQDPQYATIDWKFNDKKVLVVHRLAINPALQGKGYARKLMDFAEDYATENSYTVIRLDAFIPHDRVIQFYLKRNYQIRGETFFPGRTQPFYCMEKVI
ncbi:MAG: GNAT superfamily N-acetyltransferase [Saprospiraceae bacterium]|jgi:GNAT superfamily N-acetyltransferase